MCRKISKAFLAGVLALAVTACSDENQPSRSASAVAPSSAAAKAQVVGEMAGTQRRMAISHSFTIRLPSEEIDPAVERARAACLKLDCIVLKSEIHHDYALGSGALAVQLTAPAFEEFMKALVAPPGQIIVHVETAEDKTLAVLDVDARLKTKQALHDRLEGLLKDQGRSALSDLLAIEKEMAQVESDIEAAVAQQNYLHKITETIKVDIEYRSQLAPVQPPPVYEPIILAFRNAAGVMARSVATVISFLAGALPWVPLMVGFVFALRWLWRLRRRGPKAGAAKSE